MEIERLRSIDGRKKKEILGQDFLLILKNLFIT